jgi:hypothetical protein
MISETANPMIKVARSGCPAKGNCVSEMRPSITSGTQRKTAGIAKVL